MNMAEPFVTEQRFTTIARPLLSGHRYVQLMGHGANATLPFFLGITWDPSHSMTKQVHFTRLNHPGHENNGHTMMLRL